MLSGRIQTSPWVKARGIVLYALWGKNHIPSDTALEHPTIWARNVQIDLWQVTRLQWLPAHSGSDEEIPWIAVEKLGETLDLLREHLALIVQSNRSPKGAVTKPVYLIFHIEELRTWFPSSVLKSIRRNQSSSRSVKDSRQAAELGAQEEALDYLQHYLKISHVDPRSNWTPSNFSHYDRDARQRGWIILSPKLALAAKLTAQQVDTLISLLQPRDIDNSGKQEGILPSRYEAVHARVMQWNATHEIFEAVVQLEDIVESGQKSTDGQLWLNFTLAAIGVLLAIFASPALHWRAILALFLLGAASVLFALYARDGRIAYLRLGWLLCVLALLVATVI
jgi:hypothetical protein